MVTGIGCSKCKAASSRPLLVDDAMVAVEELVDSNQDFKITICGVGIEVVLVLFGLVCS
jgi:hypothetical protein